MDRGAFTLSVDLEVVWDLQPPIPPRRQRSAEDEPRILDNVLELLDRHGVPATFAVVGGLLRGPDDARSKWPWRAPELVERIRRAAVPHEIASHSVTHPSFDSLDEAAATLEFERARAIHRQEGVDCTSFVFPWNRVAHVEALARSGFEVYRSVDAGALGLARAHAPALSRVVSLVTKAIPSTPPLVLPRRHRFGARSIVEIPSSLLLIGRGGLRRMVRPSVTTRKIHRGLHAAAREAKVFHLWFHPSNFYEDAKTQYAILDRGLAEARRLADEGKLDLRTMASYAKVAA